MPWTTAKKGAVPVLPSSPRFVPAAPVCPDFNGPLEPDPWEDASPEEEMHRGVRQEDLDLQAEFEAWETASDEALERMEDSLPE